jgi:outer membrane protein OmpA-like peptidoglycan-associated protein
LKIVRNFTNAIKNIGGQIYEPFKNRGYMFLKQVNKETWAEVYASDYYYDLTIVEKGEVEQEITANAILKELNETGKAILYINFDSGKSTIKKESMPVVEQIIEMMNQAVDIKISVEGHTDSDGSNESNLKLSEARAKAVGKQLLGGIDAARLLCGLWGGKNYCRDSTAEGKAKTESGTN